jgi:hypothetical protein
MRLINIDATAGTFVVDWNPHLKNFSVCPETPFMADIIFDPSESFSTHPHFFCAYKLVSCRQKSSSHRSKQQLEQPIEQRTVYPHLHFQ